MRGSHFLPLIAGVLCVTPVALSAPNGQLSASLAGEVQTLQNKLETAQPALAAMDFHAFPFDRSWLDRLDQERSMCLESMKTVHEGLARLLNQNRPSLALEANSVVSLTRLESELGSLLDFLTLGYWEVVRPIQQFTPGKPPAWILWEGQVSSTMSALQRAYENLQFDLMNRLTAVDKSAAPAQLHERNAPAAQLTAEQDRQRLLDLLHIGALRPGVSGTPNAPNAANYDESKASPFPSLPDALRLNNGQKVTTPRLWWAFRRPEIVEFFSREIYGRVPQELPSVKWQVTSVTLETNGSIPVTKKELVGHVDNSLDPAITVNIQLTLTTPANAAGPVPVIMELTFVPPPGFHMPPAPPGPTWQQQVLARGWGYANIIPITIQPDNGAGLIQGIIGLVNKGEQRKLDDWGALRAWAWGASRALDYFETDTSVDATQIGIAGHSRYGKAALIAMAYDERFAIAYISSSGEGGANLYRRHFGEQLENLAATGEYHWMAGNFLKYAGPLTANDLPVDSHELLALCAPRPVFISAGATEGDGWVDARGMFLAEVAAGPVYQLLGSQGLATSQFPPIETPLVSGNLAFRQHSSGHTPAPNWPAFLAFAARYLHLPAS